MIHNRLELKEYLDFEQKMYVGSWKHKLKLLLTGFVTYDIWKFMKALRILEYHTNSKHFFRALIWQRIKNRRGEKLGIYICENTVGKGFRIWHDGCVIVHEKARIGENCQMHGMNCVGNKGVKGSGTPVIGNNVNIGIGAHIIGDIRIADDTLIAANAVVSTNIEAPGTV